MKTQRMLELLKAERECVLRNTGTGCQRDCAACDLVQDADELREMYDTVILLLGGIEPHVLTLSEINVLARESAFEFPICVEERVPVGKWTGGSTLKWCGSGFLRECYLEDGDVYYNAETYNVTWRAWMVWPTPEQREAKPWILMTRDEAMRAIRDGLPIVAETRKYGIIANWHIAGDKDEFAEWMHEYFAAAYPESEYGRTWRAWRVEPDDKRRKAVKWDVR